MDGFDFTKLELSEEDVQITVVSLEKQATENKAQGKPLGFILLGMLKFGRDWLRMYHHIKHGEEGD